MTYVECIECGRVEDWRRRTRKELASRTCTCGGKFARARYGSGCEPWWVACPDCGKRHSFKPRDGGNRLTCECGARFRAWLDFGTVRRARMFAAPPGCQKTGGPTG